MKAASVFVLTDLRKCAANVLFNMGNSSRGSIEIPAARSQNGFALVSDTCLGMQTRQRLFHGKDSLQAKSFLSKLRQGPKIKSTERTATRHCLKCDHCSVPQPSLAGRVSIGLAVASFKSRRHKQPFALHFPTHFS